MSLYTEGKRFDKINFTEQQLEKGEYENCTFANCNFSATDLSGINFSGCEFRSCNLSMAKTLKTGFCDIQFTDCKLLGLHFETCNEFLFSAYFENCILNLSSFYRMKIKKTKFSRCSMHEVDLSGADLSGAIFDNCDLAKAKFENTILERADLRTSWNYSIDPEINKIKKAKFSKQGIAGLLDKYDIEIE
ncbi:MAG: pentapeptide repeat-containing protein [Bacteroidetes bacterium]|nr:pentapeptide repeat-containing protein [Bacteroidota bacterium]